MTQAKRVLIIGLDPELLDFSSPDFAAFPGLNAAKVRSALEADQASLHALGYEVDLCLTDTGDTAATAVARQLGQQRFDCVVIGAGIRAAAPFFLLFERLVNVIHEHAPQAKIAFNTKPSDTADAVRRWI
jgi:hypothetical protein